MTTTQVAISQQRRPIVLLGFLEFDENRTPRVIIPVRVLYEIHDKSVFFNQHDPQKGDFVIANYSNGRSQYMVRYPFVERAPKQGRAAFDEWFSITFDETKTIPRVFEHFYDVLCSPATEHIRFCITLRPDDHGIVERFGRLPSDWHCVHVWFYGREYSDIRSWKTFVGLYSDDPDSCTQIIESGIRWATFNLWWSDFRLLYNTPSYWSIDGRNQRQCRKTVNSVLLDGALALHSVFTPYILLWILEWLPWVRYVPEFQRMKWINGVYASCKRIQDQKSTTSSKTLV